MKSTYNREVLAIYRDNNCLGSFVMGRLDAPDSIPMGSHRNCTVESPSGEIEFVASRIPREVRQ